MKTFNSTVALTVLFILTAIGFVSAQIVAPDNGLGTADLPVPGHPYTTTFDTTIFFIIDGLPPGTTIKIETEMLPLNINNVPVGGTSQIDSFFDIFTELSLTGTGSLSGYHRDITIPLGTGHIHWGTRMPGNPVQAISADWNQLQMQIIGDPDFDLLRITGGNSFGLPSPGHTTLTQLPEGSWAVDSFFDITYRIDFVGAPGGTLAGRSGSTTGTIKMAVPEPISVSVFVAGIMFLRRRRFV